MIYLIDVKGELEGDYEVLGKASLYEEKAKGKWIYTNKEDKEKGYGGYCSNCNCDMPIFMDDWKMKYCETNFCPHCGAKMKGGAE